MDGEVISTDRENGGLLIQSHNDLLRLGISHYGKVMYVQLSPLNAMELALELVNWVHGEVEHAGSDLRDRALERGDDGAGSSL